MVPVRTPASASPKTPKSAPAALPPWLRHAIRSVLHLALDACAVIAAYYLAYLVRFHWAWWTARFPAAGGTPEWFIFQRLLYAVVPLWLGFYWYSARLYDSPWMAPADRFLAIAKGALLGATGALLATYIYSREEYSRMLMLLAWPLGTALTGASHALVLALDRLFARLEAARPVLLIGSPGLAQEIRQRILDRHPEASVELLDDLPAQPALEKLLSEKPYYELILLKSSLPHARLLSAAEACAAKDTGFKMVPDLLELRLGEVQMDRSLGIPAYRIQHTSMTRFNFMAKRLFDLVFSTLLLAALSPLLLLICVLIKLDSRGPILFAQGRFGFKGRTFDAYKFRTMVADAEARIAQVKSAAGDQGAFFKAKEDPRITRVGKWLRKFSLDEFPQFLNVLRGEMSVVGPRPLALTTGELESLERQFGTTAKKRMNILPGITGLWQVSGRSDVSSEQRFALDLFYIEHWSLGMDLEIILKTPTAMLFGRGAY